MHRENLSIKGLSELFPMVWLLLAGFLVSGQIAAEEPISKLFQQTENVNAAPDEINPDMVLRQRMVDIRFGARSSGTKAVRSLELNLFDDVKFNAVLDRVDKNKLGDGSQGPGYTWIGHIDGTDDDSAVTLSVAGQKLSGSVEMPNAAYLIRNLDSGGHVIREIEATLSDDLLSDQSSLLEADVQDTASIFLKRTFAI